MDIGLTSCLQFPLKPCLEVTTSNWEKSCSWHTSHGYINVYNPHWNFHLKRIHMNPQTIANVTTSDLPQPNWSEVNLTEFVICQNNECCIWSMTVAFLKYLYGGRYCTLLKSIAGLFCPFTVEQEIKSSLLPIDPPTKFF